MTVYRMTRSCLEIDACNAKYLYTYGISACGSDDSVIMSIPDISADGEAVAALCEKMNRHSLSISHFYDAIEDFLCENY